MRILIAEDDPVSRRLLEATLRRWGYDVVVTCDGEQALAVLTQPDAPNLAVIDWMMPGLDGPEVCQRVRAATVPGGSYTYIILLTARGQKEDIVQGMDSGADDYITKPFDSGELQARLRAARRILDLQAELILTREQLREQATHDSLTGLWNRPAILDVLYRELARGKRESTPVGLLVVDIDRFKAINDTYGHRSGDAVLMHIARLMQSNLRSYDTIGRYGGEEFLIVLPNCDLNAAANKAEKLRAAVSMALFTTKVCTLAVTVSLGVACSDNIQGAEALIHAADEALYQAKRNGRNRLEVASTAASQEL